MIMLYRLKQLGACDGQVQLFEQLFGDAVQVTEELCIKHAGVFDWQWASEKLLKDSAKFFQAEEFILWQKFNKETKVIGAKYNKILHDLRNEFHASTAKEREILDKAIEPIEKNFAAKLYGSCIYHYEASREYAQLIEPFKDAFNESIKDRKEAFYAKNHAAQAEFSKAMSPHYKKLYEERARLFAVCYRSENP